MLRKRNRRHIEFDQNRMFPAKCVQSRFEKKDVTVTGRVSCLLVIFIVD